MNPVSNEAQRAPSTTSTRRGFLRHLTLGSVAAAAAVGAVIPAGAAASAADTVTQPHPGCVKVYRFSTRGTASCKHCRNHHRYMVFRTRKVARQNRAHPGCDCPIKPQWIERKTFRMLFKVNGVKRDVANLRKP